MPETTRAMPAAWTTIAAEQVRMVGLRFRVAGCLLLALGVGIAALFVRVMVYTNQRMDQRLHDTAARAGGALARLPVQEVQFSPAIGGVVAALALVLPLAIWQDEPPLQRGYHLVMPLRASRHTLVRVLAGWCWLMLITALYLALFVGTIIAINALSPSSMKLALRTASWWEWLVPFTAATIAYLLASGAAVGARRPIVWLGGVVIAYIGALTLLTMLHRVHAAGALAIVWAGRYGAAAALAGQIEGAGGMSSLTRWIGSTLLWGSAAVALLVATANRRAE